MSVLYATHYHARTKLLQLQVKFRQLLDDGSRYTAAVLQDMRAINVRKLASELGASNWEGSRRLSKAELVADILRLTASRQPACQQDVSDAVTSSLVSTTPMMQDVPVTTDVGCVPANEQSCMHGQVLAKQRFSPRRVGNEINVRT